MALNSKGNKQEQQAAGNSDVEVLRAKELESGAVSFDMKVNGVTIYRCIAKSIKSKKSGEDVDVIDLPQYKGSDGKYYNYAWFPISFELRDKIIEKINSLLG